MIRGALLLALLLFGGASALAQVPAAPTLDEEFLALCAANAFDMDAAVATARNRGYEPVKVDPVGRMTRSQGFKRGPAERAVVALFGDAGGPGQDMHMTVCSVITRDKNAEGAAALRRWAGPTAEASGAETQFFFVERNGARTPVAADNDVLRPLLYEGGFSLLTIKVEDDGSATASLARAKLKK